MKRPARPPLVGTLTVPGDKSISHRALILGALAAGRSRVTSLNTGTDVRATAACLERVGVTITWSEDKTEAVVESSGYGDLTEAADVLDAGNSGTTMRLLAGVCAAVPGLHVLTGDESLRGRPMSRIVEPLRAMGATIDGRQGGRLAPLTVRGAPLTGIDHGSQVASAQVKSALILAGLRAEGVTSVSEPSASRDHTERMLGAAGVTLDITGRTVTIRGGQEVGPRDRVIPGDISSAFYLLVAACLTEGSDLTVTEVGLNPTRVGGLEALQTMGADVTWAVTSDSGGEPSGWVTAKYSDQLQGTRIAGTLVPRCVDEIPALAVAASQAHGTTTFEGVAELRVKESDRLRGLTQMLRSVGAQAEDSADSLLIEGPTRLSGGTIDPAGDHRMALAAAIAASIADGDVRIRGWSAVETSFPEFVDLFARARGRR